MCLSPCWAWLQIVVWQLVRLMLVLRWSQAARPQDCRRATWWWICRCAALVVLKTTIAFTKLWTSELGPPKHPCPVRYRHEQVNNQKQLLLDFIDCGNLLPRDGKSKLTITFDTKHLMTSSLADQAIRRSSQSLYCPSFWAFHHVHCLSRNEEPVTWESIYANICKAARRQSLSRVGIAI
jgi:hypothetical protein